MKVDFPNALETYRIYFNGMYILDSLGNLRFAGSLEQFVGTCSISKGLST